MNTTPHTLDKNAAINQPFLSLQCGTGVGQAIYFGAYFDDTDMPAALDDARAWIAANGYSKEQFKCRNCKHYRVIYLVVQGALNE